MGSMEVHTPGRAKQRKAGRDLTRTMACHGRTSRQRGCWWGQLVLLALSAVLGGRAEDLVATTGSEEVLLNLTMPDYEIKKDDMYVQATLLRAHRGAGRWATRHNPLCMPCMQVPLHHRGASCAAHEACGHLAPCAHGRGAPHPAVWVQAAVPAAHRSQPPARVGVQRAAHMRRWR